ncbi:MAG: methylated-DNA--[protein]-cysteine S-methyltransferase [Rickettsia endosymbiont of Bryobia graminum]|nr:methylated-DNA--[protein]-cysteine S-methyltransferase [Rickettsia endosymbiont of Bryobia graminum]
MIKSSYKYIDSPISKILLTSDENVLTGLYFAGQKHIPLINDQTYQAKDLDIFNQTNLELTEYFAGSRIKFTIPYHFTGTDFQKKIWSIISDIPYGGTISYQDVANTAKNPQAVRAAANAVGRNKLSIIVPCHRIIGSNSSLTGYAGGLHLKQKLLSLEGYSI